MCAVDRLAQLPDTFDQLAAPSPVYGHDDKGGGRKQRRGPGGRARLHAENAHLRHETAAHITDALRVALLRAHGYSVAASDFVSMEHTRKNRLIVELVKA